MPEGNYRASIREFKVFPSIVRGKQLDAWWRIELLPGSMVFSPSVQMLISERDTGPWFPVLARPYSGNSPLRGIGAAMWTHGPGRYLKLQVIAPDGSVIGESESMEPVQAMTRKDYLEYRDALRLENLELEKATGFPGFYIPRAMGGCVCPDCSDEILGGAPDSNCPTCYGTGLKNAYYPALRIRADWGDLPKGKGNLKETSLGPVGTERKVIKILPFPVARYKDVFVDAGSGTRYVIENVGHLLQKIWVLRQTLTLSLLPKSDPAYKIPLPGQ